MKVAFERFSRLLKRSTESGFCFMRALYIWLGPVVAASHDHWPVGRLFMACRTYPHTAFHVRKDHTYSRYHRLLIVQARMVVLFQLLRTFPYSSWNPLLLTHQLRSRGLYCRCRARGARARSQLRRGLGVQRYEPARVQGSRRHRFGALTAKRQVTVLLPAVAPCGSQEHSCKVILAGWYLCRVSWCECKRLYVLLCHSCDHRLCPLSLHAAYLVTRV